MAKYTNKTIANELRKTALNESYYGNALLVALDFPLLSQEQRNVLRRYLNGTALCMDHIGLQEIAMAIETHWN